MVSKPSPKSKTKALDLADLPNWSLEHCFAELERIVDELESEQVSLDESLALFERGMKVSARCQQDLQVVEQKIKVIMDAARDGVSAANYTGRAPGDLE